MSHVVHEVSPKTKQEFLPYEHEVEFGKLWKTRLVHRACSRDCDGFHAIPRILAQVIEWAMLQPITQWSFWPVRGCIKLLKKLPKVPIKV